MQARGRRRAGWWLVGEAGEDIPPGWMQPGQIEDAECWKEISWMGRDDPGKAEKHQQDI